MSQGRLYNRSMAQTTSQTQRRDAIRQFIFNSIDEHPKDIVAYTANQFNTSRQAISNHIRELTKEGLIEAHGKTRSKTYKPAILSEGSFDFSLSEPIQEDVIWQERIRPLLGNITDEALRVSEYGLTEMLNNAVDHSEGTHVSLFVTSTVSRAEFVVHDNGVGIFRKIRRELGLADERHAILELTKGKFTTDPSRHSGEGIFFTSRAVDQFYLVSRNLIFAHTPEGRDWLLDEFPDSIPQEVRDGLEGTLVALTVNPRSRRPLKEVFDRFASVEDYGFSKTHIPVSVAKYGDANLVSRSQAKRLLARVDQFREVVLDFTDVRTIGQAFADEIFRVFKLQHPEVHLIVTHSSPEVDQMIQRVQSGGEVLASETKPKPSPERLKKEIDT